MRLFPRVRRTSWTYVADPATADRSLSVEEIRNLAGMGPDEVKVLTRTPGGVRHLIRRFLVTWKGQRELIRSLNTAVQSLRNANATGGVATTLSPRDAVKYLSAEELEAVTRGMMRDNLARSRRIYQEAKVVNERTAQERARLRYAAMLILNDPRVPQDLKDAFSYQLSVIGQEGEAVELPRSLEDPDVPPALAGDDDAPEIVRGYNTSVYVQDNDFRNLLGDGG